MSHIINKLIDDCVRCVKCGAKLGQCDCWDKKNKNTTSRSTGANAPTGEGLSENKVGH